MDTRSNGSHFLIVNYPNWHNLKVHLRNRAATNTEGPTQSCEPLSV